CTITTSHMTAWFLAVNGQQVTSTPTGGVALQPVGGLFISPSGPVGATGNAVQANPFALQFDFGLSGSLFVDRGAFDLLLCFSGNSLSCFPGETQPGMVVQDTINGELRQIFFAFESFPFQIGVAAAAPELSTWAMMILGFLGLGFL